jgi:flavin-dependent dehydrogenase
MFDVIVVGARCAGSPLAMLLSRKGYRVLLVDKARFPSDTVSTHLIWQAGLARAHRWGLLDRIADLGAPRIHKVRMDIGEFELAGCPPSLDGIDYAVAPRRTALDKLLVDAAVEAGAELREDFYIREIVIENGRAIGIRGCSPQGAVVQENAHMVVGADGRHSVVAHAVRSPRYAVRPSGSCAYYAYWRGGPPISDFEIFWRTGFAGGLFPTTDGLVSIFGGWNDSFASPKDRPEKGYRRVMEAFPRTAEFLDQAEQVQPVLGRREFPAYFRKPHGDGWALAGDAGYHKHPLSAQGITDAFRDSELLSEAIHDGFSGRRELSSALADYERQRNEAVMPIYESTCQRARLEPLPTELLALFRALRHKQRDADRFFGTDAGTVPIREFFAPENAERIIRDAPSAALAFDSAA